MIWTASGNKTGVRLSSPDSLLSSVVTSFFYDYEQNNLTGIHEAEHTAMTGTKNREGGWYGPTPGALNHTCTTTEFVYQLAVQAGVSPAVSPQWLLVGALLLSTLFTILYTKMVCLVARRREWRRQCFAANQAVSHAEDVDDEQEPAEPASAPEVAEVDNATSEDSDTTSHRADERNGDPEPPNADVEVNGGRKANGDAV